MKVNTKDTDGLPFEKFPVNSRKAWSDRFNKLFVFEKFASFQSK